MKKVFLFILLCGCLALSGTLKAAEGQLMAGTAKINITPKQNIPLHDSVYARALVMEVGDMRVAQCLSTWLIFIATAWLMSAKKNTASRSC